jgi:hypothetical protein
MVRRVILFVCVLVLATAAGAQQKGYPTHLLNYPSVQKELGMTNKDVLKLKATFAASQKRYLAMLSPSPSNPRDVRQPTLAQVKSELNRTESEVLVLLNTKQRARLRQIGYQSVGAFGLSSPEMVAQLKITEVQRGKLREASNRHRRQLQAKMNELVKPGHVSPKNPAPRMVKVKEVTAKLAMMKALSAEAEKILTRKQLAEWKAMQGRPFPIETLLGAPAMPRTRASAT